MPTARTALASSLPVVMGMGESQNIVFSDHGEPTLVSSTFHSFWAQVVASDIVVAYVESLHAALASLGVPKPHPTADQIAICTFATFATLVFYWVAFGRSNMERRAKLDDRVQALRAQLAQAEAQLQKHDIAVARDEKAISDKPVRIWMDGAFDMMHYGHMNAFRQGRARGTHLIVGINSDESITKCKGPPVMNDEERIASVAACKFVDEVVPRAPYIMNDEYLKDVVFGKYKVDYVVHGDDPCIVDGRDVYEAAVKVGKYRTIPRTEGVSTTDIVGRMLLVTKSHHKAELSGPTDSPRRRTVSFDNEEGDGTLLSETAQNDDAFEEALRSRPSNFLATQSLLQLFGAGTRAPAPGAKVVYMDGAWDMFHAGHAKTLQKARELGDYVLVGVHSDKLVNRKLGSNYPILNMHERVLSVLGCKWVDDVLLDAPWTVSETMIKALKIQVVAHGTHHGGTESVSDSTKERYGVAMEMGMYQGVESPSTMTVGKIVSRIKNQEERFKAKFAKKIEAENEYYGSRYGEGEDECDDSENKKSK